MKPAYPVWCLNKGAERRFQWGHPWVFSNELSTSPKGITPGEVIELRNHDGKFLAYGYGNPNSLIALRVLSRNQDQWVEEEFFYKKILSAYHLRKKSALSMSSHRLLFAEGDFLPGLIIDRYFLSEFGQAFVVQSSTAGMDYLKPLWLSALERFAQNDTEFGLEKTAIILANNSTSRSLEQIPVERKTVLKDISGVNFNEVNVKIQDSSAPQSSIIFTVDILGGQKTGFFLDQRKNIQFLVNQARASSSGPIRVLDLCCYVGQWSTQVAHISPPQSEYYLLDASSEALRFAQINVERQGGTVQLIKGDVLKTLANVQDAHFDIVICDPPAFIKKKKDIPTGSQAYLKLNKEAIRKVKNGGLFISCSCSGLFAYEEFKKTLAQVSFSAKHNTKWIYQGFHSPDHPQRLEFPEGQYLKCMVGQVER